MSNPVQRDDVSGLGRRPPSRCGAPKRQDAARLQARIDRISLVGTAAILLICLAAVISAQV